MRGPGWSTLHPHAKLRRRLWGAVLPRRLLLGPQRDPGQVDAGHLAAAHACPQVV
ncbi:hypothetical protein [Streptomyces sp. NPDC005407]|uniref:hypothetical protein n=1 Tax=Streptomyces sp. NPDC005407 TaxID=3155340 RepID=UPI0033A4068A